MRIGICDDNEKDRMLIYQYCEDFLLENRIEHEFCFFSKGEEVLMYCKEKKERIDLLFLDVEMDGISGIELKNMIKDANQIWRVVFVSSHKECVWDSFGIKTIGFVTKPGSKEEIEKWIRVVLEDIKENVLVEINNLSDGSCIKIKLEEIIYFKGERNYTQLFLFHRSNDCVEHRLITKKIGVLEKAFMQYPIIRVHKSYMVNLLNVLDVGQDIALMGVEERIPIGRAFKELVRNRYVEFAKEKVSLRI